VPLDVETCVDNALQTRQPLNSACDQTDTCASGLLCYSFQPASTAAPNGVNACVTECDPNTPCPTPDQRCLYTNNGPCATDADCASGGLCQEGLCQTFVGACFKAAMKEGESCALPSSATCGLKCSLATDQTPNCQEEPSLGCFTPDLAHPELAACYALCSQDSSLVCPNKSQTCTPLTDPNGNPLSLGVCTPLSSSFCLLTTGVACSANGDCDSGICSDFGTLKTCTNYCDLLTKSGCPEATECIDIQLGCDDPNDTSPNCPRTRGACKPTSGKALPTNCQAAQGAGCGCSSQGPNALESLLALASLFVFWSKRKKR
jgi:hypothetical protein